MASMLEVLREYKHLAARKKTEGALPPELEVRLTELEGLVRTQATARSNSVSGIPKEPTNASGPALAAVNRVPKEDSKPSAPTAAAVGRPTPERGVSKAGGPPPPARSNGAAPLPRGVSGARATSNPTAAARATSRPSGPAEGTSSIDLPSAVPRPAAVATLLPADAQRRAIFLGALAIVLMICSPLLALAGGISVNKIYEVLVPGVLLFGGIGWIVVYPALMAWRENAAKYSSNHLNEPDFEAKVPNVEPVILTLTVLGAVLWLMVGDIAKEGLDKLGGYLGGMLCGMVAIGLGAALIVRPMAWKSAKKRAFRQYLEGGVFNLNKGNAKRARRLFERALDEASTKEQAASVIERLKTAAIKEADELRAKGRKDQADEILRSVRKRKGMETITGWAGGGATSSTGSIDLLEDGDIEEGLDPAVVNPEDETIGPVVLWPEQITVRPSGWKDTESDPDTEAKKERARSLIKKNRNREALQIWVELGVPVDALVAKNAAEEYIGAGYLRSADAIYQALGEKQIPEFYKAVAVEWVKNEGGNPPPQPVARLVKVLTELGERQAATRLACQGALTKRGTKEERRAVGQLALDLCRTYREEPPPEVLEVMEEYVAAGMAYEQEDRKDEALRAYRIIGEKMIAEGERRDKLIPILSKIFLLEKTPEDKFLEPLVRHVIESNVGGPNAIRILTAFKVRHKNDEKVAKRLFDIYLQTGKHEDALAELTQISQFTGSNPESTLQDFLRLKERFPDEPLIRLGVARAQIRAGKAREALKEMTFLLQTRLRTEKPQDLLQLIDSLLEWGKADIELRKERARLKLEAGDRDAAIADFETYVKGGGRDPEAIQTASGLLTEALVTEGGAPSYEAHQRLATFYLSSGEPAQAVPLLEVLRASDTFKQQADLLLGRAELAASNPRRALQVLHEAIEGRHPTETPELHYELARAYESLGDMKKSGKIDAALEHFLPGFSRKYASERPSFGRADTDWLKGEELEALGPATDPGEGLDAQSDHTSVEPSIEAPPAPKPAVSTMSSPPAKANGPTLLKDVLLPRYKLGRCLGSGGMGEVHLADDVALGREVAIKVLRRTLATDLFISKFRDEARIVAQLSHPGIVGVYDIGQQADWSFIVMEYVRGPNLATLIGGTTPPSRRDIIGIIAAVADAMAYAHKRGVIHRDLKPANILVGADGTVKVTDFGIARVLQTAATSNETAFSAAGMQVGTVNYMAPEQILGQQADARTDIYLLATTLYFSLSKQYPYTGDAVVVRKTSEDATPLQTHLPDASQALDQCLRKAMARDPKNRFSSMIEFSTALRGLPEMDGQEAHTVFH